MTSLGFRFGRKEPVHHQKQQQQQLREEGEEREELRPPVDDDEQVSEYWANQCQKYEERIVELHSVIAELSRKLEDTNDVIREESEFEETSVVTDSCLEEEDEEEHEDDDDDVPVIKTGKGGIAWTTTDKASLAFERALPDDHDEDEGREHCDEDEERSSEEGSCYSESKSYQQQQLVDQEMLFKIELFDEMEKELFESRTENERLLAVISEQEKALEESAQAVEQLRTEKEAAKRQLEDLQATLEFQEAKMDQNITTAAAPVSGSFFGSRSSSVGGERRRRSLRRKKELKADSPTIGQTSSKPPPSQYRPPSSTPSPVSSRSPYANPITRSMSHEEAKGLQNMLLRNKLQQQQQPHSTDDDSRLRELALEFDRLKSHASHVESQNQVLELSLEDSKSLNDKFSVALSKRESNESVLTLSLHYCDAIIEAYDVLVALLETENSILSSSSCDVSPREENGSIGSGCSTKSQRARSQRRSAEKVARHLLNRLDRSLVQSDVTGRPRHDSRPRTSVPLDIGLSSPTGCWEDSSGYSHTTSSTTSTASASSCHHHQHLHSSLLTTVNCDVTGSNSHSLFTRNDEARLRDSISQLKTIRASIQSTLVEVEAIHSELVVGKFPSSQATKTRLRQLELEEAVMRQEMMASREEKADLRAKVYLLEKEKSGLKMILEDRDCMEQVLRTRIQHLEEILDPNVLGHVEDQVLRQRINNLFDTLDKVSRNANERHKHAIDLIEDLRKANSTLTEALERSKRKYQSKIKKMEQQLILRDKDEKVEK